MMAEGFQPTDELDPLLGPHLGYGTNQFQSGYQQRRQTARDGNFISGEHGTYLAIRNTSSSTNAVNEMDNPVTVALKICQQKVLTPYMRLLLVVGWQPIFVDPVACCQKTINFVHPLLVVMMILLGYAIQYAACFHRDSPEFGVHPNNSTNVTDSSCWKVTFSQYLLPDLLHSAAYVYSFYLFRVSHSEQLPTLIERVFLQTSPTQRGFLSQGKLIRTMRLLLYLGVVWVLLSQVTQILHVISEFDNLYFGWMGASSLWQRVILAVLMLLSYLCLDLVYTVVVINYCVQCSLLRFYIEGLQEKIRQKIVSLKKAMTEYGEIETHLKELNYTTALALSIVLFNFGSMAFLGSTSILQDHKKYTAMMFAFTIMAVLFWVSIMMVPITQAARLTAACNGLRKIGHEVRVRPFAYQETPEAELDTFLLFTSTLNMRAKIFLIPVRTSYLCCLFVTISFIIMLLFQTGGI